MSTELQDADYKLYLAKLQIASARAAIADELPMLRDALTALEKGKTHITKDHLERSIDGLQAAFKQISSYQERKGC